MKTAEAMREEAKIAPDTPFSIDEVALWETRLESIQREFEEKIKSTNTDKSLLERELAALKSDFQLLQESVKALTQRGWMLVAAARIQKWSHSSFLQKILPNMVEIKTKLFPDLHVGDSAYVQDVKEVERDAIV